MAGAGYSLDTRSSTTTGPVDFGSTFSGGGTVIFGGGGDPAVTAAVTNITGNPWLLALAGAVVLGVAYFYFRSRK